MPVNEHEILNGPRPDYWGGSEPDDEPMTLERVETFARDGLFSGPEGCNMILRLLELVRAIRNA